jgi:hypothetical protein
MQNYDGKADKRLNPLTLNMIGVSSLSCLFCDLKTTSGILILYRKKRNYDLTKKYPVSLTK